MLFVRANRDQITYEWRVGRDHTKKRPPGQVGIESTAVRLFSHLPPTGTGPRNNQLLITTLRYLGCLSSSAHRREARRREMGGPRVPAERFSLKSQVRVRQPIRLIGRRAKSQFFRTVPRVCPASRNRFLINVAVDLPRKKRYKQSSLMRALFSGLEMSHVM